MKSIKELSRLELAAFIAQTLKHHGIDVVLTGGSCVSIYSSEKYVSSDLDFIDVSLKSNRQIGEVLKRVGFINQPKGSRHFVHPDSKLTVEFPSAPLTVGDEHIDLERVDSINTGSGPLWLLSPTDCVKDRLANYYYFKDNQCFEQALLVAQAHPISLKSLETWHRAEGQMQGYSNFISSLERNNSD